MSKICDFWQKKIEKTTLWKITLAFLTIAAGYTLVYKPLRSIIERYYTKFDGINKDNLDKFLKKTEFSSRLNKKLIC
jgi:transposase-like protein